MSKPYMEGSGWAYRLRIDGRDLYRSGFSSQASALRDMEKMRVEVTEGPAPSGLGAHRTSLGVAFADYARQRLPYLKGAQQDARRINRYLRALNLPVISLVPVERVSHGKSIYWEVHFVTEAARTIPASLKSHRHAQARASQSSESMRKQLAMTMMAEVTTHRIQVLINALRAEGKGSATIYLERSELRRLFKHAIAVWKWRFAGGNPAGANLDMPTMEGARDRVVSNAEWARLSVELANYPNPHVAPLACLMLETAMRSCEPLVTLCWGHIDWERRVIALPDAKAGKRDVPLGRGAIHILRQLRDHASGSCHPHDRVFPTTYEAVKKGWAVARAAAGIPDVRLHDLRHTSATRFALEFKGNLPVLMVITGHKTVQMVMRYVNVKATDVATLMHGEELDVRHAAAGYQMSVTDALDAVLSSPPQAAHELPEAEEMKESAQTTVATENTPVTRTAIPAGTPSMPVMAPRIGRAKPGSNVISVDFKWRAA